MIRFLEIGNDFIWLVLFFLIIALSPAIIMTIIGFAIKKNKPKSAKVLFIIATIYTIIGLSICGAILSN